MAFIGETIYEDYLYKFTGKSRSILWGKGNPWRQKYFVIKRIGNKPVLEIFSKKPKTKNSVPKDKVELSPSFRVEKVTNMKNRAYVFQITTPDTTICLSTDEQRSMDIFVFFLKIQTRLKDQIRDDFFQVYPENSEAQRRIGAKGTSCILHVSPYGLTLALQSNRAVLAQWPLKSIRSYESSETGQLSIEAGRVAPMGDGLYIFSTELGCDNQIYDLIDRYVLDTLEQIMPGLRGGSEEIEDYVVEAERLLALTVVSACTPENPDIRSILRENWCTDLPYRGDDSRPRHVVHTRLVSSESLGSLNSQNSITTSQSVPGRLITENGSARNSPQVPRSLPFVQDQALAFQNFSSPGFRRGSNQSQPGLGDRPPPPLPGTAGVPMKIPPRSALQTAGHYLRMNSAVSRSQSNSGSPFSPSSADWVPPPTFRDAMRQKSTSPISESDPYPSDSYLTPSPGIMNSPGFTATSTPNPGKLQGAAGKVSRESYLTPLSVSRNGESSSTKSSSATADYVRMKEKVYLNQTVKKELKLSPAGAKSVTEDSKTGSALKKRARRLRSASCEDISDYLRLVMYDPVSKSMNDLLDDSANGEVDDLGPEPFPRLQSFSGVLDRDTDACQESYYNIDGLKGKIYDGPSLPFSELRKKFSKRSLSRIRRSVSNPNFMAALSLEKLNMARVNIGITNSSPSESRTSLVDLLPEGLKKHLTKDSSHKRSSGALSSGACSKSSSRSGSRTSSAQASPHNSLQRRNKHTPKEEIVGTTSVKGINLTRRSRSFRRQKPVQNGEKKENNAETNQSVEGKGSNSWQPGTDNQSASKRGDSSIESQSSSSVENSIDSQAGEHSPEKVNSAMLSEDSPCQSAVSVKPPDGSSRDVDLNKSVKNSLTKDTEELKLSDMNTRVASQNQDTKLPKVAPKPRAKPSSKVATIEISATSSV